MKLFSIIYLMLVYGEVLSNPSADYDTLVTGNDHVYIGWITELNDQYVVLLSLDGKVHSGLWKMLEQATVAGRGVIYTAEQGHHYLLDSLSQWLAQRNAPLQDHFYKLRSWAQQQLISTGSEQFSDDLAQDAFVDHSTLEWLSSGVGKCSMGGSNAAFNASMQYRSVIMTIRSTANLESLREEGLGDFSIVIGLARDHETYHASLAVGISEIWDARKDHHQQLDDKLSRMDGPKTGLALEGQLFHKLNEYLGIGLYASACSAGEIDCGGITLNLVAGKLR